MISSRSVHFTKSQRDNVQLVLDDYILKKKKGPFMSRGMQVINWFPAPYLIANKGTIAGDIMAVHGARLSIHCINRPSAHLLSVEDIFLLS